MSESVRITPAQETALRHLIAGRRLGHNISGISASGGFSGTRLALIQKGLITRDGEITDAGRAAIDALNRRGRGNV